MSRANRRMSAVLARKAIKAGAWTPFVRDVQPDPVAYPALGNVTAVYTNSIYAVFVAEHATEWGLVRQLMVRRFDEAPIRSWSDMQRIKNEIAGEDATGVEVYPAQDAVHDSANMYHIWILPSSVRLPFGLGMVAS